MALLASSFRIVPFMVGSVTVAIGAMLVSQRNSAFLPGSPVWAWFMLAGGFLCLAVVAWPASGRLRAMAGALVATTYALRGVGVAWNAAVTDQVPTIRTSALIGSLVWLEAAALVVIVWLSVVIPGGEQWRSMRTRRASSPSSGSSPDSGHS